LDVDNVIFGCEWNRLLVTSGTIVSTQRVAFARLARRAANRAQPLRSAAVVGLNGKVCQMLCFRFGTEMLVADADPVCRLPQAARVDRLPKIRDLEMVEFLVHLN
jgi:hypothetical protein